MEAENATGNEEQFEGVWYNGDYGEFEQYELDDENDEIVILSTDGSELDRVDYLEIGASRKVDENAVDNPVEYFNDIIDSLMGGNNIPFNEEISMMYARENVEVVERM